MIGNSIGNQYKNRIKLSDFLDTRPNLAKKKRQKQYFGVCIDINEEILMESLHSSTRGSRKVAGLTMNKETDESIISSFDCRDTSEIELDTAESNLLDALKEYSDSAANVLSVLKDSLGSDCSSWNKNPKLTRLKPYLRDWYLETKWKPKIGHASILLKCREEEVVATMKTLLKKKSSKELKASDPELYNFSVNTRRIVLYFIENTIIKRAIALKEVMN